MGDFSHLNEKAEGRMVDVGGKTDTTRQACVRGIVVVGEECGKRLDAKTAREIVSVARVAGMMAAKNTAGLIPFCHQVALSKVEITIDWDLDQFGIEAVSKSHSATGVEMEAFVAAQIAGTTIYDMVKAVAPDAIVGPFMLVEKTGGKNGRWERKNMSMTMDIVMDTTTKKKTASSTRKKLSARA